MSAGPQHYAEAERLLAEVGRDREPNFEGTVHPVYHDELRSEMIAKAQVHATLALAAATMDSTVINGDQGHSGEWGRALATVRTVEVTS